MKILILILLLVSPLAIADISIETPTHYDNGETLIATDIDHYVICISTTSVDSCDSEISVTGNTIASDLLPSNTHHIKAKTVLINGRESAYSPIFTDAFRFPLPPGLKIQITIEVQ
jgi:hypothetical protein